MLNPEISFRHNVMTVQTPDTFVNIRGGFSSGRKDVYFVRTLGENQDFLKTFEDLDGRLAGARKSGRIMYVRLKSLPNTLDSQVLESYLAAYDSWKQGKPIITRIHSSAGVFPAVLDNATRKTVEIYKTASRNVSESMIRNYVIKLWYWMDTYLEEIVKDWSEVQNVKILADNIIKLQEYLFCYFSTLLGCDVLILNNRADISVDEKIRRLSSEIMLGSFGSAVLPEHAGCETSHHEDSSEATRNKAVRDNSKTAIAPPGKNHPQTTHQKQSPKPPAGGKSPEVNGTGNSGRTSDNTCPLPEKSSRQTDKSTPQTDMTRQDSKTSDEEGTRREKTYEELAQLASSIVMIAIHDSKGESIGTGSGIMIGEKGFILTNCHVIKGGYIFAVRVENDDKVYVTTDVIKYNAVLDLAVIRIERELKPLPVYDGRSNLVRGQKVIAIGSPLGLFNSVSDGIISGFRNIRDVDMIQFTAPISPGSSGGAVLNMYGEVIGISTAGFDSGQNINLAVDYSSIRFFARGFF